MSVPTSGARRSAGGRCLLGATTAVALTLASAAPAVAAAPRTHSAPAKPKPAVTFHVRGVISKVAGTKVTVLSSAGKVGARAAKGRSITLQLSRATKKHRSALRAAGSPAPLAVGQLIDAAGTVAGNGTLQVQQETSRVLPAQALIGQVESVTPDGQSARVAAHSHADGASSERDNNDSVLVALTGAALHGPAVAVGQYIVVLGEHADDVMDAADLYTYASTPTLVVGQVTASDSATHTITVAPRDHEQDGRHQHDEDNSQDGMQGQHGQNLLQAHGPDAQQGLDGQQGSDGQDGQDGPDVATAGPSAPQGVSVDMSNAQILLNGEHQDATEPVTTSPSDTSTATTSPSPIPDSNPVYPQVGDQVLVVGSVGATPGTVTAAVVLAFDHNDHGSVQDNRGHHHEHDSND